MSDVAERVRKIVIEHLRVEQDKVTDDANFMADLGADSLDAVELVLAFEDEFGCKIPDDEVGKLATIKGAVGFIETTCSLIVPPEENPAF